MNSFFLVIFPYVGISFLARVELLQVVSCKNIVNNETLRKNVVFLLC